MSKLTKIREMLYDAIDLWGFDDIVIKLLSIKRDKEIAAEQRVIYGRYKQWMV